MLSYYIHQFYVRFIHIVIIIIIIIIILVIKMYAY